MHLRGQLVLIGPVLALEQVQLPFRNRLIARHEQHSLGIFFEYRPFRVLCLLADRIIRRRRGALLLIDELDVVDNLKIDTDTQIIGINLARDDTASAAPTRPPAP